MNRICIDCSNAKSCPHIKACEAVDFALDNMLVLGEDDMLRIFRDIAFVDRVDIRCRYKGKRVSKRRRPLTSLENKFKRIEDIATIDLYIPEACQNCEDFGTCTNVNLYRAAEKSLMVQLIYMEPDENWPDDIYEFVDGFEIVCRNRRKKDDYGKHVGLG